MLTFHFQNKVDLQLTPVGVEETVDCDALYALRFFENPFTNAPKPNLFLRLGCDGMNNTVGAEGDTLI